MSVPVLKVFKIKEESQVPSKSTQGAACFDIRACLTEGTVVKGYDFENFNETRIVSEEGIIEIEPGDRLMIPTGLIFDIPEGYSLRFHPRSGCAIKQGLILANCEAVIDYDYVDESMILLMNTSGEYIEIKHGDRICQAELVKDQAVIIEETAEKPVQKTDRTGGLGHTGVQ